MSRSLHKPDSDTTWWSSFDVLDERSVWGMVGDGKSL